MEDVKLRILNLSTHDEDCGIGKYQEDFIRELKGSSDVESVFYPTSPNILKKLTGVNLKNELKRFKDYLRDYDILHVQHEFGFFHGDGEGLAIFMKIAKDLGKKVVITIHTAPSLVHPPAIRTGRHPKAYASYYKRKVANLDTMKKRLLPFRGADKIITLNSHTTEELINLVGVKREKIYQTVIPVEFTNNHRKDGVVRKRLGASTDKDIILATVGFLSDKKGTDAAIKSLRFLPQNFKLAILGGINPISGNPQVYDAICDLITTLELNDRVYISGYVSDDNELDKMVASVDIALYPYDPQYYKWASSAAINTALNNDIPVVAYPTDSFKEINARVPGTIAITKSPNYYELARGVIELDETRQKNARHEYLQLYSLKKITQELVDLYKEL